MKFIARNLNLIGLLLLAAFGAAAAGLYFHTPNYVPTAKAKAATAVAATPSAPHKAGCCAEKPVAAEPPSAATCPHLAALAASATQTPPTDACCPKPANP
jgi:hypothetical protein